MSLSPSELGLPPGGRRRTPGLRREEVSQSAGISVTWYTWLEQGREINVSDQVLNAIARTLRLDEAERAHLFALSGHVLPVEPANTKAAVSSSLHELLRALNPYPSYLMNSRWDIVAWNDAYSCLFSHIETIDEHERNLLWFVFVHPAVRKLLADWEFEARRLLAQFRSENGIHLAEPSFTRLVDALMSTSQEFRNWWPRHDVAVFSPRRREFNHPAVGHLTLEHHKMIPSDHPELRLVMYTYSSSDASGTKFKGLVAERLSHRNNSPEIFLRSSGGRGTAQDD